MRVLVLSGEGIQCEEEMAFAFEKAGFQTELWPIGSLLNEKKTSSWFLKNFSVLALPGGFSYGDELGAGTVLALQISKGLHWDLASFAKEGRLILGVCNGFQTLVRLGVFGNVALGINKEGKFIDTWVAVQTTNSHCAWIQKQETLWLPIRHKEGRFGGEKSGTHWFPALRYLENPNGSEDDIAGIYDATGNILGLMPHPEGAIFQTQCPWHTEKDLWNFADGFQILKNAKTFLEQKNTIKKF